ncbi:amino acid ABC transporter permease [Streptomyces sp. NPDC006173]|uniref:amino acid ABC transporter permease n=1 Tax=Streptomyces sp. NPDC006173 TaxID=3155349 RepID=UPI0033ECE860
MTDNLDKSPEGTPPPGGTATKDAASGPPPESIKAIPVRHYGRWVSAVVVVVLLVALGYAFSQGNIQWHTVGDQLFVSSVVQGAGRTLLISVLAMIVGVVLGIILAVMRLSKNPVTSTVAWLYIWFFRGTPVYVQLLLWFNLALIFPVLNLGPIYKNEMTDVMTPFMCALLGLGLNEAAYMAEICRAGLLAVDEGQTEASHALGMSHTKTLFRIVIPQAMRVIVPPTGNEFINMLKTSSLVYAVTYNELLRSTSAIGSTSYAVMEMLFVASIWYLAMTSVFSVFQYYLERYYARGSSRSLPPTVFHKIKVNMLGLGRERGNA